MFTSNMQSCISNQVLFVDLQRHADYKPFVHIALSFLNEGKSKRTQWISNDDNQLDPLPELQMSSILEKTYVWLSSQFGQPKQKWG